ncbi:MAG: cell division protein FtsL [Myxococcales bacterium]|nr:cell division protein FtsL [Myxococcales bacterium]
MSVVVEARSRGGLSLSVILLEILPAALAVLLLAGVGVVHVTGRVMVVKMGYELSRLDAAGSALTRENDQLRLELATLRGPVRLEGIARSKLGLAPPAAGAVIHLKQ